MALIKKDYGLIYNDDGSLCTTARDDDIPFQGVKSYAVEEATTNLIDFSNIPNAIVACSFTKYNYKYDITTDSNNTAHVFRISNFSFTTSTATVSFYISKSSTVSAVRFNLYNKYTGGNELWGYFNLTTKYLSVTIGYNEKVIDLGDWWYISLTSDVTTGNNFNLDIVTEDEDKKIIIKKPQVEQKPFATSFVDGSREYGKLNITDFSIPMDNFVMSFWINFQGKSNTYGHIFSLYDDIGNLVSPYTTTLDNFNWQIRDENGNVSYTSYESGVFTGNTNEWQFVVIILDENGLKVYRNGVLKQSLTFTRRANVFNRIIFYSSSYTGLSYLLSNLFIGEYKDKNGKVIWTDEYIQEVYEAKKPFNTNM